VKLFLVAKGFNCNFNQFIDAIQMKVNICQQRDLIDNWMMHYCAMHKHIYNKAALNAFETNILDDDLGLCFMLLLLLLLNTLFPSLPDANIISELQDISQRVLASRNRFHWLLSFVCLCMDCH